MADQAINALPTKSAPSTGDKVLMIGTAEEYQMLVDDLATAVLNKLTSKTYNLDQGSKTLIAALNELNSKSEFYPMQNSGETVIFNPKPWDAYIAMLQHSGGYSYYIASIMNDANQNIKIGKISSNNDDMFSLTVDEDKNVVISSSTRYWTCVLFNLNYKN